MAASWSRSVRWPAGVKSIVKTHGLTQLNNRVLERALAFTGSARAQVALAKAERWPSQITPTREAVMLCAGSGPYRIAGAESITWASQSSKRQTWSWRCGNSSAPAASCFGRGQVVPGVGFARFAPAEG